MWRELLIVGACATFVSGAVEAGFGTAEPDESPAVALDAHAASRRVALVIGNARYAGDPLVTPVEDADAVSRTLRSLGFEVVTHVDLDARQMKRAIADFHAQLRAGGVGLFYFAGHGFRVHDETLLAPVDADRRAPAGLVAKGVALRDVLDGMAAPRPRRLNLVILDTCRNSPFAGALSDAAEALPDDTLVAYAAAPGGLAADGVTAGTFTDALLRTVAVPGAGIEHALRRAAATVARDTAGAQTPRISSSLTAEFVLAGSASSGLALPAPLAAVVAENVPDGTRTRGILPKDSAEQYELAFWDSIKDSEHASDYEAYLKVYPNGRFAALARARIERLRAAAPKTDTPAKAPAAPKAETPAKPAAPAAAPRTPAVPERASPAPAPQAAKPAAPSQLKEIKDCPACPALVELPRGEFGMGSNTDDPSERPAHRVTIGRPFAIGKYEVTNEQWAACVAAAACAKLAGDDAAMKNAPARDLSWNDARQYVQWLSKTTGKSYRLPTEAEWEYAVRGGTATRYWWGAQMAPGKANCKDCGEPWNQDGPANVGSFAPNPYGLYDLNGSVWEWVADCWHSTYKGAPDDGRAWDEANCRARVIRGGSWREGADYMLASTRFKYDASVRHSQNGFRVARDMD
ncbi:SUMF1/EgtB/PvdO family nonheme iron enzyme [Aromatoleum sp.]|uniref:SUMF1/EgtB/PvdO family nonheme iron enzyme n=1 Tax=Aromatoleum sp. TaxID=2307007 RepID=UPI002FC5ECB4